MPQEAKPSSGFRFAVHSAEKALQEKKYDRALQFTLRALERDPKSFEVWSLRAKCAEGLGQFDERVYSLHQQLRLMIAQNAAKAQVEALRSQLQTLDPVAKQSFGFSEALIAKLQPFAESYEKEKRPHSAIRVHQRILALDPNRQESQEAIDRLSAAPDPSLAATAKPKDLLAGVSEEWIQKFDATHSTWQKKAKHVGKNYVTFTDAGYEVLIRTAHAMDQMNSFYREFFRYGTREDGSSISKINLHVFKNREEYLKLGIGPPVEWSGGHFTGSAVELFIDQGGYEEAVGTLFHEAAHQFVSLATNASGWLNEGLASFFEGCRILANGTVLMNLPANHRLFPLVARMQKGWMSDPADGIDPQKPSQSAPEKAPTFRMVLENKYSWGPPWYAPTWGVVYFLYNYQDPVDGRFIYRKAFREFINKSGGRAGQGAVANFEKIVLDNPAKATVGVDFSKAKKSTSLPKTVEELNEVWKNWLVELAQIQSGTLIVQPPYLDWGRHAVTRQDWTDAKEHFEKGLAESPENVELLEALAELEADRFQNTDRASKLILSAVQAIESREMPDSKQIEKLEEKLTSWDPKRKGQREIEDQLSAQAKAIVDRYMAEKLYMMAMDAAWRYGSDLGVPKMFSVYEEAARKSEKTTALWQLAYNESNFNGWDAAGNDVFTSYGETLRANFGGDAESEFSYRFLTYDKITSGDFSFEAEVLAEKGKNSFCGLVFGKKGTNVFHALVFFPGKPPDSAGGSEQGGFIDLSSFYGPGDFNTWRHNPVNSKENRWHTLRLDVTGPLADVWFDGELVVSHEFSSINVLRGTFGLLMGSGSAQFRNLRYLAREPRDQAAEIERKIRMGKTVVAGKSVGGSWLGQNPPFPGVTDWLQNPRASWDEVRGGPTLLVLWSPAQNEAIPLHEWLADLNLRYHDAGLSIISICEYAPTEEIKKYLENHPFPGSAAVDKLNPGGRVLGETFEKYAIDQFFLPRLVLLDIHHKVVWEGDPGFRRGNPWNATESYLEGPLRNLVEKWKIRPFNKWKDRWTRVGVEGLRSGNLKEVLPLMTEAQNFSPELDPLLHEVAGHLERFENAVAAFERSAESMAQLECEPAIVVLQNWAKESTTPLPASYKKTIKPYLESQNLRDWKKAIELGNTAKKVFKTSREKPALENLLKSLAGLSGYFPKSLLEDLQKAFEAQDMDGCKRLLDEAPMRPQAWLAKDFLRWTE